MKKRITILLAVCLLLAEASFGQRALDLEVSPNKLTTRNDNTDFRADNGQIVFGYATALNFENVNFVGIKGSNPAVLAMAIDLPNDVYKGFELAGATVHISRDPGTGTLPSNLKLIVVDASSKKLIAEKKVTTPIEEGLNTIILDKPLKIGENKSYQVGYLIMKAASESSASWFSFDRDQPSLPESNRIFMANGTSEPSSWDFKDYSSEEFGSLAVFPLINTTGDTWKDVASTNKFESFRFSETGSGQLFGELYTLNKGFADITSAVVRCQIGDGDAVEETFDFSSTPIKPGYMLPIEVPTTFSELGLTPTIKVQLISVNGSDNNLLPTDTYSGKTIVEPAGGSTTMNSVLYERFTTEQCLNCPPADRPEQIGREELEESGLNVSRIAHHAGYYTDWLTNKSSEELLQFLKISSAPSLAINRYVSDDGVYNVHPVSMAKSKQIARRSIRHTTAEITSIEQAYDKGSQKLAVKVAGKTYANIDPDNLFVNIVITESGIKAKKQSGASAGYIHDDVPRIFATGTYGEKLTITDDKFSFEMNDIEIPDGYKTENMKVVVFLSRNLESPEYEWDINIYDSKTLYWGAGQSTEDVNDQAEVFVTSRNGAIVIEGEYSSALVYDLAGRQVAQTDLAAGVYIVRVETPQGVAVHKVAVR